MVHQDNNPGHFKTIVGKKSTYIYSIRDNKSTMTDDSKSA